MITAPQASVPFFHIMPRGLPRRAPLIVLVFFCLGMLAGTRGPAYADGPWYVDPAGDDAADCRAPASACRTIGAAVARAAAGDSVHVAPGTYPENLVLQRSLTLEGAGAASTIIDGGAAGPVVVVVSGTVRLAGVTVRNGATSGVGGGIQNGANLTLTDSTITGNTASLGGGIFNTGNLALRASLVLSNTASLGGGLFDAGTSTVEGSVIRGNHVLSTAARTVAAGGGIYVTSGGATTLRASSLDQNEAFSPVALMCDPDTAIGGGAYVAPRGFLSVQKSAVTYNRAEDRDGNCGKPGASGDAAGGGIANDGRLWLETSTVSDNVVSANTSFDHIAVTPLVATATGGGIANTAIAYLRSTTISANAARASTSVTLPGGMPGGGGENIAYGGGIATTPIITATAGLTATLTLLAENKATTGPDCAGALYSEGYNLVAAAPDCAITGAGEGDQTGVDARLGPLALYGGPTLVRALLAGSPAIDSGGSDCSGTDQHDRLRPADGDGDGDAVCDIGASEFVLSSLTYLPIIAR